MSPYYFIGIAAAGVVVCLFLFLFGDLITKAAKSFGGDE